MNPDRLAELEEERRFLLRSLSDLERERQAGDVEEHDYQTLRDGYTSRAATVLRAIEGGHAALPAKPQRKRTRLAVTALAIVAFGALAGWLLARSSGQRLIGDSMTGDLSPDRITTLLAEARTNLGSDPAVASNRYLEVLQIDPDNAEAQTYTGWLLALSTQGADDAANLAVAKEYLTKAIADDPNYPDPHCFLAVIAARFEVDQAAAVAPAQACLDNDPPTEMRSMIAALVTPTGDSVPATSG